MTFMSDLRAVIFLKQKYMTQELAKQAVLKEKKFYNKGM